MWRKSACRHLLLGSRCWMWLRSLQVVHGVAVQSRACPVERGRCIASMRAIPGTGAHLFGLTKLQRLLCKFEGSFPIALPQSLSGQVQAPQCFIPVHGVALYTRALVLMLC